MRPGGVITLFVLALCVCQGGAARHLGDGRQLLGGVDAGATVSFGQPAGEGDFPHFAMLLNRDSSFFGCGGTLINAWTVVTAGHCLVDSYGNPDAPWAVAVGITAYNNRASQFEYRLVRRVVRNRDFNPLSLRGDVGLLLLKAPITNIQPAALPPPDLEIPEGEVLLTAGFGLQENQRAASRLMYAAVPYIPRDKCDAEMRRLGVGGVADNTICAGFRSDRRDSCAGDSGGPLIWKRPGRPDLLVGVVSWGPTAECGKANLNLGAYSSMAKLGPWVDKHTAKIKGV